MSVNPSANHRFTTLVIPMRSLWEDPLAHFLKTVQNDVDVRRRWWSCCHLFSFRHDPDRLSTNPKSPHYNEEILKRNVGIRFNGVERTNVEEYCVSEGWIRVTARRGVDRHGNPLLMKISGTVEPFFKEAS